MLTVRDPQLRVFGDAARQRLVEALVAPLRRTFPRACGAASDEQVEAAVARLVADAVAFGVATERDVAAFVMLHFATSEDPLGPDRPTWVTGTFHAPEESPSERVHAMLLRALGRAGGG